MTGHNRTQPDTKPDIPDMGTRGVILSLSPGLDQLDAMLDAMLDA